MHTEQGHAGSIHKWAGFIIVFPDGINLPNLVVKKHQLEVRAATWMQFKVETWSADGWLAYHNPPLILSWVYRALSITKLQILFTFNRFFYAFCIIHNHLSLRHLHLTLPPVALQVCYTSLTANPRRNSTNEYCMRQRVNGRIVAHCLIVQ